MATFGEIFKKERELRKISLREVSEATKIGLRYLEAMEEGHFDQLPGGVFNKGFIRAYAKFIGLDGEVLVNSYLQDTADQPAVANWPPPPGILPEDPAAPDLPAPAPAAPAAEARPRWLVPALVAAGTVIVAAVGVWVIVARGEKRDRVDTPSAPAPKRHAAAPHPGSTAGGANGALAATPAGSGSIASILNGSANGSAADPSAAGFLAPGSGTPGDPASKIAAPAAAPPRPPRPAALVAAFSVARTTYLELWCDGRQRLGRDVAAGETEQISCDGEIRISSSNAGAVTMRIDGNDCVPMGPMDEPLSELTVSRATVAEVCPPQAEER